MQHAFDDLDHARHIIVIQRRVPGQLWARLAEPPRDRQALAGCELRAREYCKRDALPSLLDLVAQRLSVVNPHGARWGRPP